MAVTYTKQGYDIIEKGLRNLLNDDFQNVYIGNENKDLSSESIRINLNSSTNLVSLPAFEQRDYDVEVRYYFNRKMSDKDNINIKSKVDRLNKKLLDNMVYGTSWANLIVEQITYNVQDEENEEKDINIVQFDLTLTRHNPL